MQLITRQLCMHAPLLRPAPFTIPCTLAASLLTSYYYYPNFTYVMLAV
jgi:hypothetical protein